MGVAEQLYKFGVKEWLPDEWILHYIDPVICDVSPTFCQSLLIAFSGCSLRHKNATAVANYLSSRGSGLPMKRSATGASSSAKEAKAAKAAKRKKKDSSESDS